MFRLTVFLVSCHGDIFRKMVLLAQHVGMRQGEYTFIFFHVLKGDPVLGDYTWKKGDSLDPVLILPYIEKI